MSKANGAQWCCYVPSKTLNCLHCLQLRDSSLGSTNDYLEKEHGEVALRSLLRPTGTPAPDYAPGCDDVHQEVDRNGTGGMFLRTTQKWRI